MCENDAAPCFECDNCNKKHYIYGESKIDEIAEERADIKVGKVNVDDQMELATAFKIINIPTLLVLKDGKVHPLGWLSGLSDEIKSNYIDNFYTTFYFFGNLKISSAIYCR